jgi:uncharacterized membrane protein YbhN (UPF0104 family)
MKTALKFIISAALLAWVLSHVNMLSLRQTLSSIPLSCIALLLFCYIFGQFLSALKWWCIIREAAPEVPFWLAIRSYFLGMFVNVAGIGTVGGDMVRALAISPYMPDTVTGLGSVVADRLHGLTVIATIGVLASLFFGFERVPFSEMLPVIIFGIAVILGWSFGPLLAKRLIAEENPFRKKIENVIKVFPHSRKTLLKITAISLLFHLIQINMHAIMFKGVGVSAPWSLLLSTVPFVNIASSLPISWQGLGVRENAYRYFFVPFLLTNEQAVAFGAMWIFAVTVSGLFGGMVAFLSGDWKLLRKKTAS